jgi:hypothetical protein
MRSGDDEGEFPVRPGEAGSLLAGMLAFTIRNMNQEVANVAAFARLYGVLRFFYPSDASAELDWNRFAVHGVSRVRPAADGIEIGAILRDLVSPLGPGIDIAQTLPSLPPGTETTDELIAWRYLGPGFSNMVGPYEAKRTGRALAPASRGSLSLVQTVPADELKGKMIRLTGRLRAERLEPAAGAELWLRVNRSEGRTGFRDEMDDRKNRESEWCSCEIEGTVDNDAVEIALGVMAVGSIIADFGPLELCVRSDTGEWNAVLTEDGSYDEAGENGWRHRGMSDAEISRLTDEALDRGRYLRIAPAVEKANDELFDERPPTRGAHADIYLGSGLQARVSLAQTDAEAGSDPFRADAIDTLRKALAEIQTPTTTTDVDRQLADIVVVWNVLKHFYPYWAETSIDWDERLIPNLRTARSAASREEHQTAVRHLIADAQDGHGSVNETAIVREWGQLPVILQFVEGSLVIVSSSLPSEAPVGATVVSIDGEPAVERFRKEMALASGSRQWKRVIALRSIVYGSKRSGTIIGIDDGSDVRDVTMEYAEAPPVTRPDSMVEMEPGLWYVDLTRAKMDEIEPKLDVLASAVGVVFDVRGYPTDAGMAILPHLVDVAESDRWMHVAKIVGPYYEIAGWENYGWNLQPSEPHISGTVVFLTDSRAISYAESVMGYVADRKLGTIVGGPTAGTNGNVAGFVTPGGFDVRFTGMRVTHHDGSSPFHLVGVQPDVPVEPTISGIREGRDEVLERGLAIARAAMAGAENS